MIRLLAVMQTKAGSVSVFDSDILDQWEIPFGEWIDQMVDWIDANMTWLLDAIEWPFTFLLKNFVDNFLAVIPWIWVVLAIAIIGSLVRSPKIGVYAGLALALCGLLGTEYWLETVRTVGMVLVAVLLCALVGIPLGVASGRLDAVWNAVRPILDAMQVVHAFVYMLPVIFFWGIGVVPGTMVTMVFALPPLIRLTNLGIRQVPEEVVEASRAFGASEFRVLTHVQLPLARQAIMTGLNQTLLMSIAMIGIVAIMGAGGLGRLVYKAVQNFDIAASAASGLALFLVAVILDRLSQPEEGDTGNLFSRIHRAWSHRSDPEALLPSGESAAAKPSNADNDAPANAAEKVGMRIAGVGGLLAVVSVFLTWGSGAGRLSGHARFSDLDLTGESFNGLAASGGSMAGYAVLACGVLLLLIAIVFERQPGSGSRWFSPDGAVLLSAAMFFSALTYFLVRTAPDTVSYSYGIGIYVALLASGAAVGGSIYALWAGQYAALRPLTLNVSWGKVVAGFFALIMISIGTISGWTFDERLSGQLTEDQQVRVEELRQEAVDDPSSAALNTLAVGRIYNEARLSSLIILDGWNEDGGGLGGFTLVGGIIGALMIFPAAGVFGTSEHLRWRWSALVAAVGLGVTMIGVIWVGALLRVGENLIVTGTGAFLTMLGGFFLLATSKSLLKEFHRNKVYDDAHLSPEIKKVLATSA